MSSIVNAIAHFNPKLSELANRINSSFIELSDISNELELITHDIVYDPEKIEDLTFRLDTIIRLQQKHQVQNIEELIIIKDELSDKLLEFNSLESEIKKANKELKAVQQSSVKIANKISANRKKNIPTIEKEITSLLSSLSIFLTSFLAYYSYVIQNAYRISE